MEKSFDAWNCKKKDIAAATESLTKFPKEGEVWVTTLGKNIGFEQNGSGHEFLRPMLIVTKFNNHMFWAVPLSTKQKPLDFYFNFTDSNHHAVALILAQLRLISIKRLQRKMYEMPKETMVTIKKQLRAFL